MITLNNHGAGDYLEIAGPKKEILVPYNFDHIMKIDIKEKNPKLVDKDFVVEPVDNISEIIPKILL